MLPGLPQLRTIAGAVGTSLNEIRVFLSALKNIKFMSGTEVTVTFTITGTIKRVVTGLGYPPTGFIILAGHTFNDLAQNAIPATEVDKTVLYLSAGSVGTYTIWVF